MARYAYAAATTGRFTKWFVAHYLEHRYQPSLKEILHWLRYDEDYATPLDELKELCEGLRLDGKNLHILQWITNRLVDALKEERRLVDTAKEFFGAMIDRFGINDFDVKLNDGPTGNQVGTLHDLQLRKEEPLAK